jgi:hypothetical protein
MNDSPHNLSMEEYYKLRENFQRKKGKFADEHNQNLLTRVNILLSNEESLSMLEKVSLEDLQMDIECELMIKKPVRKKITFNEEFDLALDPPKNINNHLFKIDLKDWENQDNLIKDIHLAVTNFVINQPITRTKAAKILGISIRTLRNYQNDIRKNGIE